MIDADKTVMSWEWYDADNIFDRLVDRLPVDEQSRYYAARAASCGEPESAIGDLICCADGVIPHDTYLELELNRDRLDSIEPYLLENYEEMLQRCTVAVPDDSAA